MLNRVLVIAALSLLVLSGCNSEPAAERSPMPPVATDAGEECHLCGMLVKHFPGPKGQSYIKGLAAPQKFCSTIDLLAWMLQPESRAVAGQAYVHDMAATDWDKPSDDYFIDARSAFYVHGHSLRGAMGHTFASFKSRQAAAGFAQEFGGQVVAFAEISPELIAGLAMPGMGDAGGMPASH